MYKLILTIALVSFFLVGCGPENANDNSGVPTGVPTREADGAAQKDYHVILQSYESDKEKLAIKTVREVTGLGLADAKNLVDNVPSTLKSDLTLEEAAILVDRLADSVLKVKMERQ